MAAAKLTDREREVLALAWQCFESVPKVDYNKLAQLAGFKTPASATTSYLSARKKLLGPDVATAPAATTTGSSARVPKGRKRGNSISAEDEAPRKRGRKAKGEVKEDGQEEQIGEEDGVGVLLEGARVKLEQEGGDGEA